MQTNSGANPTGGGQMWATPGPILDLIPQQMNDPFEIGMVDDHIRSSHDYKEVDQIFWRPTVEGDEVLICYIVDEMVDNKPTKVVHKELGRNFPTKADPNRIANWQEVPAEFCFPGEPAVSIRCHA